MGLLRRYIREALKESRFKQMSKSKFTDLKAALENSSFLDADPEGDLDDDEEWNKSEDDYEFSDDNSDSELDEDTNTY